MQPERSNMKLVLIIISAAVGMFGFGFAMVPLYDVFCDITGINGKVDAELADAANYRVDEKRTVTIEFVTTLNESMPWNFQPQENKRKVHPGQPYTTHFRVENTTDNNMVGQAIPSVAPGQAAEYFKKIECFCFKNQTMAAGEIREMPVTFIVDPKLPPHIDTLALSYTFFDVGQKIAGSSTR